MTTTIYRPKRYEDHEASLAPYAVKSGISRGRRYSEDEHEYRSPFQRDRDRVIHSHAFRRLEYKTQVFVYHEGDHYRTRLTHTMEVAQICRTITRTLGLNEDIGEAIALAHDLGHPPFGHTGEDELNSLMEGHGGFEHNGHTLRIVEFLEKRYPNFPGLNLTWEVREGIVKHNSEYDHPGEYEEYDLGRATCLEAQVADISDEIAYNNHDIDDGLSSGMLTPDMMSGVTLWREAFESVVKDFPRESFKVHKAQTIVRIINRQVTDLVESLLKAIGESGIESVEDVRAVGKNIASFSTEMVEMNRELKEFLYANLYRHNRVTRMSIKARRIINDIFKAYESEPLLMTPDHIAEMEEKGKYRTICDYIAGMTDRFAIEEHQRLFDPMEKV